MIELKAGQILKTENPLEAYKLIGGNLDVFLIPVTNGVQGRPMFVIHMEEGMTIPSLSFTDKNYTRWMLQFEATEVCHIQPIEKGATRPLKKRFCRMISDTGEDHEGMMETLLTERYLTRVISDDVLIARSESQREKEKQETDEIVRQAAEGEESGNDKGDTEKSFGRKGTGKLSKRELAGMCVYAALIAISTGVMIVCRNTETVPAAVMCSTLGMIIIHLFMNMFVHRCSEGRARDGQIRMYEDLYSEEGDRSFDQSRAGAALAITYYDMFCAGWSKRMCSVAEVLAAAATAAVVATAFPIPVIITAVTVLPSAWLLHSSGRRTAELFRKVNITGSEGRTMLLEAFSRIEKVRLAGAAESIIRRFYSGKKEEKKYERRIDTGHFISGILSGILILAGGAGVFVYISSVGGYDKWNSFVCLIACGLIMAETMSGAIHRSEGQIPESADDAADDVEDGMTEDEATEILEKLPAGEDLIKLDGVSFAYNDRQVCRNISLTVKKGEHLGIVGPSGSGKSTLMKILAGDLAADSGEVLFIRWPMDERGKGLLRSVSSRVLQNDQLLTTSIGENIICGDSSIDERKLGEIAERVGLAEDVGSMPMGYDTLIREDGENISAGQKQKILLARAMASEPGILFLDEADSELDTDRQELIQDSIRTGDLTTVTVSHQYSSVKKCDRIAVMDRGKMVELGTPNQLMEKKGRFYSIMQRQL